MSSYPGVQHPELRFCTHGLIVDWCALCATRMTMRLRVASIVVDEGDLDLLADMQIVKRSDCFACFSCNAEETWPFVTYGWTRRESRVNVEGLSPVLQAVVGEYRKVRPGGGRIFIIRDAAFDWPFYGPRTLLIQFARTAPRLPV
jgi:hypothetical protein